MVTSPPFSYEMTLEKTHTETLKMILMKILVCFLLLLHYICTSCLSSESLQEFAQKDIILHKCWQLAGEMVLKRKVGNKYLNIIIDKHIFRLQQVFSFNLFHHTCRQWLFVEWRTLHTHAHTQKAVCRVLVNFEWFSYHSFHLCF